METLNVKNRVTLWDQGDELFALCISNGSDLIYETGIHNLSHEFMRFFVRANIDWNRIKTEVHYHARLLKYWDIVAEEQQHSMYGDYTPQQISWAQQYTLMCIEHGFSDLVQKYPQRKIKVSKFIGVLIPIDSVKLTVGLFEGSSGTSKNLADKPEFVNLTIVDSLPDPLTWQGPKAIVVKKPNGTMQPYKLSGIGKSKKWTSIKGQSTLTA